jgi:Hypothetical protein (DUF2513)
VKRDPDLLRTILARVEEADDFTVECADLADGTHDEASVARHVQLLEEAGYVKANLLTVQGEGALSGNIERLTWAGHEFIDAARNDTIWRKAKRKLGDTLGGVPFEIMKPLLISYAKDALGLPGGIG